VGRKIKKLSFFVLMEILDKIDVYWKKNDVSRCNRAYVRILCGCKNDQIIEKRKAKLKREINEMKTKSAKIRRAIALCALVGLQIVRKLARLGHLTSIMIMFSFHIAQMIPPGKLSTQDYDLLHRLFSTFYDIAKELKKS